ncbi:hypothetical protein MC885_020718 [Smutsia gigantea]|nr:hypothetical protein MC885_020718 [Smutsia gigantea]
MKIASVVNCLVYLGECRGTPVLLGCFTSASPSLPGDSQKPERKLPRPCHCDRHH